MIIPNCACLFVVLFKLHLSGANDPIHPSMELTEKTAARLLDPRIYDKRIRPRFTEFKTYIYLRYTPISINGLDTVAGTMSTTGTLVVWWTDHRLRWQGNDSWPANEITLPQDDVWHPDVCLVNTLSDLKFIGNSNMRIVMSYHGVQRWDPQHVFESRCILNVKFFPFDEHTCELHFTTWSYVDDLVEIRYAYVDRDYYRESGQYDLIDIRCGPRRIGYHRVAVCSLTMKRKPFFVLMTTILPIVLMGLLGIFVFLLPFESGEKVSFSATVFLSFMVSYDYTTSILPNQSNSISYLTTYLVCQLIASAVQSIVTIVLCSWYACDDTKTPVPKLLVFLCKPRSCFPSKMESKRVANLTRNSVSVIENSNIGGNAETTDAALSRNETEDGLMTDQGTVSKYRGLVFLCKPLSWFSSKKESKRDTNLPRNSVSVIETSNVGGNAETTDAAMSRNETEDGLMTDQGTATEDREAVTWKKAMCRLDGICFVIFGLFNITVTALYFIGVAFHVSLH